MNIVNRLIIVLEIVVLVAFAAMVIVLAWAYGPETVHKLGSFVTYLDNHDTTVPKIVITLGAAFVILLAVAFLVLEVAPRGGRTVAVLDVGTGTAVISTAAVSRRLERIVGDLPEVEASRAKVAAKRKGVSVAMQVMVEPRSDLSTTATEVARVVEDTITNQMKLVLEAPVRLQLYYSSRPGAPQYRRPEEEQAKPPRKVRVVDESGEGEAEKLPVPAATAEEPPAKADESENEKKS
jgi:hypothetical protein